MTGYASVDAETSTTLTMRERVLEWDKHTSRRVYDYSYTNSRPILLFLELSGHGGLWVAIPLLWFVLKPTMAPAISASVLNYLALAVVDLAVIGLMKPLFRRSRPAHNGGIAAVTIHAIDQYSFPSGHATRAALNAAYIAYLQMFHLNTLYKFMQTPTFLAITTFWAGAVAVSRVALGRHHVLDVGVGLMLGVLYVAVWPHFWLSAASSHATRSLWILDTNVSWVRRRVHWTRWVPARVDWTAG